MASASSVSRIVRNGDRFVRRHVHLMQSTGGDVTMWTGNATKRQLASLSKARRILRSRGFHVDTFQGTPRIISGWPHYYLVISGRVTRKAGS